MFEAEHVETHRRVALKVVTSVRASSRADVERFEREGRLAASINHYQPPQPASRRDAAVIAALTDAVDALSAVGLLEVL